MITIISIDEWWPEKIYASKLFFQIRDCLRSKPSGLNDLGLFHDPLWGGASDELKTHAAKETSGLLGLFHDPFWGVLQMSSKPMRLRRLGFCFADLL
jgi:hypothetical protein